MTIECSLYQFNRISTLPISKKMMFLIMLANRNCHSHFWIKTVQDSFGLLLFSMKRIDKFPCYHLLTICIGNNEANNLSILVNMKIFSYRSFLLHSCNMYFSLPIPRKYFPRKGTLVGMFA
jgi:hypothetical protein